MVTREKKLTLKAVCQSLMSVFRTGPRITRQKSLQAFTANMRYIPRGSSVPAFKINPSSFPNFSRAVAQALSEVLVSATSPVRKIHNG